MRATILKTIVLTWTLIAVSVPSAAFRDDGLAFVTDLGGDVAFTVATSGSFQEVTLYLCAFNPTLGGVSGWEAAVEVEGGAVAPAWEISAGLDVGGGDGWFQVGIGVGPDALRTVAGKVHLATWRGLVPSSDDVISFFIIPHPLSTSFDGTAGYANPDDASELKEFVTPGNYNVSDFMINGDDGPFQERTWSEVKELYRDE